MKYAFVLSTNVFISHKPTISYVDKDTNTEILRIVSFKPAVKHDAHHTALIINASINVDGGEAFKLNNNSAESSDGYKTETSEDRVVISKDDKILLDVHQFPEPDFDSLQSHIYNEIEAQQPDAVFIVRGEFWVNNHHIIIENEKLFIDEDSFATGVTNNHDGVILAPYDTIV